MFLIIPYLPEGKRTLKDASPLPAQIKYVPRENVFVLS